MRPPSEAVQVYTHAVAPYVLLTYVCVCVRARCAAVPPPLPPPLLLMAEACVAPCQACA